MPTAKKTPAKKITKKKSVPDHTTEGTRVLVISTEQVPVKSLKPYYKNPRIGNVEAIAKSLHLNGQFKPIVVNIGSHTKRKNEILAGNHTWLGSRKEIQWEEVVKSDDGSSAVKFYKKGSWEKILVSWVDVDEDAALKIVLADNKTGDDSSYDDAILADIFNQVDNLMGTGWEEDEVADIIANLPEVNIDDAMSDVDDALRGAKQTERDEKDKKSFNAVPLGEEADPGSYDEDDEDEDPMGPSVNTAVEEQSEDLKGAFSLKEPDVVSFDGIGEWGIIRLREDMLASVKNFPADKLDTWAGTATAEEQDDDTWWFYNWSTGKTDKIKHLDQTIVGFFAHDEYFENWWWYANKYVTKVLNSGIKVICTPDWSMHKDMKKAEWLWQLYRQRWLGRYFQECGLKVIPNVAWPSKDIPFLKKYILGTLPKNLPCIVVQLHTISKETEKDPKQWAEFIAEVDLVFSTLEPEAAIIYCGGRGKKLLKEVNTGKTKLIVIPTYNEKLDAVRGKRVAKKTI